MQLKLGGKPHLMLNTDMRPIANKYREGKLKSYQCISPSESRQSIANSMRFPSDGFTYYLTFFSKFFSSFPHGTCSLSVSCQYSALDGVYHPFWAAFPSNPTHGKRIGETERDAVYGTVTLYGALCQSDLSVAHPLWERFSRLQFATASSGDFKFELFPLHSPLLGESLLVSFPPLINMLKFSG